MKTKIFALILLATLVAIVALAVAPAKAYDCQLYIVAGDQYSQTIVAEVYIDGNYVGTTGNTYIVSAGSHSIGFSYFGEPPYWYEFSYLEGFYYQNGWYTNNPSAISVTTDATISAAYTTIIC